MVKKAPTFPHVLHLFEAWLKSFGIALNNQEYGHTFAIVTDGKPFRPQNYFAQFVCKVFTYSRFIVPDDWILWPFKN